jgi:hypothetical protein
MSQCQPAPRRLGSSSWLIPLAEFAHARASPLARGLRESKRRDVLAAFLSRAWYRPYHQELASGRNRDKAPPPPDDCTSSSASSLLRPSRAACLPRKARRAASSGGSPVFVWAWQQSRRPKWHTTPAPPVRTAAWHSAQSLVKRQVHRVRMRLPSRACVWPKAEGGVRGAVLPASSSKSHASSGHTGRSWTGGGVRLRRGTHGSRGGGPCRRAGAGGAGAGQRCTRWLTLHLTRLMHARRLLSNARCVSFSRGMYSVSGLQTSYARPLFHAVLT